MIIRIAIYEDGRFCACPTQNIMRWHIYRQARIAEIEVDFHKLPNPHGIFGKGIVINGK